MQGNHDAEHKEKIEAREHNYQDSLVIKLEWTILQVPLFRLLPHNEQDRDGIEDIDKDQHD